MLFYRFHIKVATSCLKHLKSPTFPEDLPKVRYWKGRSIHRRRLLEAAFPSSKFPDFFIKIVLRVSFTKFITFPIKVEAFILYSRNDDGQVQVGIESTQ